MIKKQTFIISFLMLFLFTSSAFAQFVGVNILEVRTVGLEGPVNHGLRVETDGISDPNLTFYEVQIKPDREGPFPPWRVYNTEVQPYDTKAINIPYRNGILALPANEDYCVRVRAVYGREVTRWATHCGVRLTVPVAVEGDTDEDGIPDLRELSLGIDPQNDDTDGDGITDGEEVALGMDPNLPVFADLRLAFNLIDFGEGNGLGRNRNQHHYIEIENVGDELALLRDIRVQDSGDGDAAMFHVGNFPEVLTHLPPRNIVRVPISFLPTSNGVKQAEVIIDSTSIDPVPPLALRGTGVDIPECFIAGDAINFGRVDVNDTSVLTQRIRIRNDDSNPSEAFKGFGFTVSSDVDGIAPGLRGFVLPENEEFDLPILFQHPRVGDYQGEILINSQYCKTTIPVRGVAE